MSHSRLTGRSARLALATLVALTALGGAAAATATTHGRTTHARVLAAPPKLTIGFLQILGASQAAQSNQTQFERAAKLLGWKVNVVDAQGDPAKMAAGIQSFVTQKVNAIVTIAVAPAAAQQALLAAKKANIPAITIAGPNPDPLHLYAAEIAPNDSALGAILAQYMCDTLPAKSKIVAQYFPPLEALLRRDNVAKAIFAQCGIQVVASHQVDFANAVQDATKSTLDMLRANPDAAAVFADQDFEFVPAQNAIRQLGRKNVKVYGYLAGPQNLAAIQGGGTAAAIADADYTPCAWIAADQLLQYFGPKHKPIDAQAEYNITALKETLLTPLNAPKGKAMAYADPQAFFVPRWKALGFAVS
jgi:ABC-type sugar transport system substrate-binding protein